MQKKWYFIELNKDLVRRKDSIQNQNKCEHKYWIAKCSHCGKILASEIQNIGEENIKEIVENNLK